MFSTLTLLLLSAATPYTLAAPGFRCGGLEEVVCDAYLDHFSTVLARSGRIAVRTRSDLQQMLGVERQKQLLGCSDGSCLVEIVGGLGVEAVLSGGVTKTESGYLATLRVLRASDGSELLSSTERFSSASAMESWLEDQADDIAEKLVPAPRASRSTGRIVLFAAGAAALVAGIGLFAWSKADAGTLKGSPPPEQIDGLVSRGSTTQLLGLTFGIVGAAALAAVLVWKIIDSTSEPKVAASVGPVAGGAMISFSGRLP